MINLVVVHYADGKIIKGTTGNFFQNKDFFHLQEEGAGEMKQINIQDLKAVFFVKSFEGDAKYQEKRDLPRPGFGRKIRIYYKDGEIQDGYTQGYTPNRPGFQVFPCDPDSNNDRIFVITAATEKVQML